MKTTDTPQGKLLIFIVAVILVVWWNSKGCSDDDIGKGMVPTKTHPYSEQHYNGTQGGYSGSGTPSAAADATPGKDADGNAIIADLPGFRAAGTVFCKYAIKSVAKDPESVKFFEQTAEKIYPNMMNYGGKWRITGTNGFGGRVQAYGVAMLHFKGGDMREINNWEIKVARIIDANDE